jgi:hypothetical protein
MSARVAEVQIQVIIVVLVLTILAIFQPFDIQDQCSLTYVHLVGAW